MKTKVDMEARRGRQASQSESERGQLKVTSQTSDREESRCHNQSMACNHGEGYASTSGEGADARTVEEKASVSTSGKEANARTGEEKGEKTRWRGGWGGWG